MGVGQVVVAVPLARPSKNQLVHLGRSNLRIRKMQAMQIRCGRQPAR